MIIRSDKLVTNWAPYVEMGDRLCRVTGSIPTWITISDDVNIKVNI